MCGAAIVAGVGAVAKGVTAYSGYIAAASAVAGGYSTYRSRQQAAETADANEAIALQKAGAEQQRGSLERHRSLLRFQQAEGQGAVNYAAGNVLLGTGSAAAWQRDIDHQQQIDAGIIDTNTGLAVQGFQSQADIFGNQADAFRTQAVTGAATSLLGSATQVAASRPAAAQQSSLQTSGFRPFAHVGVPQPVRIR